MIKILILTSQFCILPILIFFNPHYKIFTNLNLNFNIIKIHERECNMRMIIQNDYEAMSIWTAHYIAYKIKKI